MSDPRPAEHFRPQIKEGLPQSELEGALAVYDVAGEQLMILNASARSVWECCDGTGTVGEIVSDIVDVFGVEAATVRSQVVELLIDWSGRGLLEQPFPGNNDASGAS